jgi:hypothetical protein
MARRRHGYLARLASLLLCAATVAGWAVTRELHANAVKEAGERYDTFFAAQEGRLGDAGMRPCLANQLGKPEAATLVGKPEFKPNYFLTCAVQYSYDMGVLAQIGIDGHVLVYQVTVETNKVTPAMAAMQTEGAKSKWYSKFNCAYVVKDSKITAFKEERYGFLHSVTAVPPKIQKGHFCLDMPEASQYVQTKPPGIWR